MNIFRKQIYNRFETIFTVKCSSSPFERFAVSFMQEDAYIDLTALALTLGLQVFN